MSPYQNAPLLWIDLEYTDLDVKRGKIVEISTLITDSKLNIKSEGPNFVIHQPEEVLDSMVMWNQNNFAQSGLLDEIRASKITLKKAYDETLKYIKKHCSFQSAMLAGSSVYIDREFLGEHMPEIYNYLHHHIVDVNTVKELTRRWYPKLPIYPKTFAHRAKNDIIDSINELKYYQEAIFK
jgi:oligoribonuclease